MRTTVQRVAARSIPDPVRRRHALLLAAPPVATHLVLAAAYALLSAYLPDPIAVVGVDPSLPERPGLWGHVVFTAILGAAFGWMSWTAVRIWSLQGELGRRSPRFLRGCAFLSWFSVGAGVSREGVSLALNLGAPSADVVAVPAWAWPAGWACALLAGAVAALPVRPRA